MILSVFVYRLFHEEFSPLIRTRCPDEWTEIFMKQSGDEHRQINLCNLCIFQLGLNIFYSEEKDSALHTTRQYPLNFSINAEELAFIFLCVYLNLYTIRICRFQTNLNKYISMNFGYQ